MKVCLILEGCYPYVHGGVSTWVNQYINNTSDIDYILYTIYPNREDKGKFVYDIPSNVTEIHELFLDDFDKSNKIKRRKIKISSEFVNEIENLILGKEVNFKIIFDVFATKKFDIDLFFKSKEYLNLVKKVNKEYLKETGFSVLPKVSGR